MNSYFRRFRGNQSIYLHRSGPLLENGLDRPKNCYGRYGFPSFYCISMSTVGVDAAKVCLCKFSFLALWVVVVDISQFPAFGYEKVLFLVGISAPKKNIYPPPPPHRHSPGTLPPPAPPPRKPPPPSLCFLFKPAPLAASSDASPLPPPQNRKKKIKNIRNVHQVF